MKAKEAELEILNPIGETIAYVEGKEENGEVRFTLDGSVPGIQYHLTVKR